MLEIPVDLGERAYTVSIGHGLAAALPELLAAHRGRRALVVSNRRVWSLHGAAIEKALRRSGPLARVLIADGEAHKDRATLAAIHDAMWKERLGRDGLVVAFGGGVVGDVAGFAAATWMRGVDWVQLPTTLLAMVDSSVGGKVGINHPGAKNLIGAFHQPRAVVIDPAFLATLPRRETQSGAYEILKCGVLADRSLFKALAAAPPGLVGWGRVDVENAIASAVRIKAEVVEKDEREGGLRRVLNLGHTIGHALESVTRYRRFTHGEAVGWGLVGAAWIAHRRGLLAGPAFDGLAAAVDRLGPRPRMSDLGAADVLAAVGSDKKAVKGRAVFVLPTRIGAVTIRPDVRAAEIRHALRVMAAREARTAR
jgi:3-dehydroquinate synthase